MFVGRQRVTHDSGWNSNRIAAPTSSKDVYEIRPRKDRRGFDLLGNRLPLGLLWFEGADALVDAVTYTKLYSRSHPVIIHVFDESGAVVAILESACDFGEPVSACPFFTVFFAPSLGTHGPNLEASYEIGSERLDPVDRTRLGRLLFTIERRHGNPPPGVSI